MKLFKIGKDFSNLKKLIYINIYRNIVYTNNYAIK